MAVSSYSRAFRKGTVGAKHAKRPRNLRCLATAEASTTSSAEALVTLKAAANDPSVPKKQVFQALRCLQREKIEDEKWSEIIGCNQFWRLVYTADSNAVQESLKDVTKGSGYFFPLTAAQRFNLTAAPYGQLANAAYIPHIVALKFDGEYVMKGKRLNFSLTAATLKLGPLKLGPFNITSSEGPDSSQSPFFIFFYADEDIICAQGRGGGIALWARADPAFVLEKGLEI